MTEATTLRVSREVKEEFDRLQGLVQSERGRRVSQSALLEELLRLAREHEEEIVEGPEPRDRWTPQEFQEWLKELPDLGVPTDASKYKEFLYGPREEE